MRIAPQIVREPGGRLGPVHFRVKTETVTVAVNRRFSADARKILIGDVPPEMVVNIVGVRRKWLFRVKNANEFVVLPLRVRAVSCR